MSFFVAKDDNSDGTGLAADSKAAAAEACGPLLTVTAVGTRSELPQEDTFLSDPNVRFYSLFMDLCFTQHAAPFVMLFLRANP